MIACSGMALVLAWGNHNGLRLRPSVIMAARMSIPRPYHYKQPFAYLLIGF